MATQQIAVLASTLAIYFLTIVLAFYLTLAYLKTRRLNYIFWSAGIWTFAVSVLLEVVFALGVYSQFLIGSYFFLVVLIVEFLAVGSVMLIKSDLIKRAYYAFAVLVTAALLYFTVTSNFGYALQEYVVVGIPPAGVLYSSIFGTFVAAAAIVAVAAMSYIKTRRVQLLSIILGVIVVSVAGTLYIASFPEFLYYAEFFGILLLWLGFINFRR